jgi:hypothetical protein
MTTLPYSQWRQWCLGGNHLQEDSRAAPPERLAQAIWRHQRLLRDRMSTLAGQPLRVLHPGFWNREAGPDFRRAVIRIGDEAPITGDVEVDVSRAQWRAHGHDRNPAYRGVVLHVVWAAEGEEAGRVPVMALQPFLDSSVEELEVWLCSDAAMLPPLTSLGQCAPCLRRVSSGVASGVLRQAALVRFQGKARELQARARQTGWEQALWEGLFRGLGYKHNSWPMLRLAELIPGLRERCSDAMDSVIFWQASLFGLAGFLPDELTRRRRGVDQYLRQVWDHWWRERSIWQKQVLPRDSWCRHGLRPANHPHRRLALAAHWLARKSFIASLEQWFSSQEIGQENQMELLALMQAPEDAFWSRHWTLRSDCMRRPQPLLGIQRMTDLAVNSLLPWFWVRAVSADNPNLALRAERSFFRWPKSQDNAVLRLCRQRLLGGQSEEHLSGAAGQQGLLQIAHDFCENANALCADCPFPELLRRQDLNAFPES